MAVGGLLNASSTGNMNIRQIAEDAVIRGVPYVVNDLIVSTVDAGGSVKLRVDEGDMIVGRITSGTSVELIAQDDIIDFFNDAGTPVVNVNTFDSPDPLTGAIMITAGGGVGAIDNFFDLNAKNSGPISVDAQDSVYLNEVEGDMVIDVISSAGGDVVLIADGSILDADEGASGNPAVDVIGNNITMTATNGSIGVLGDNIDI